MGDLNLIPADRLASKHRKARLRMWMVIGGAYLTALTVASLSAQALWADDGEAVTKELASTRECIEQYNSEVVELRKELAEAKAALETTKAICNQPDWSKLFILLGNELGEEIVLNDCQFISLGKGDKNITDHIQELLSSSPVRVLLAEKQQRLNLSGFGRTQSSISQFVLRLEQMDIFRQVRLVDSHRQSFLNDEAVAFSIECRL